MSTLTLTKDNFVDMMPVLYKFLDNVPEITINNSDNTVDTTDNNYSSLVQRGLDDVANGNFAHKPW